MASNNVAVRAVTYLAISGAVIGGSVALGGADQTGAIANGGFEAEGSDDNDPADWNATRVPQMDEFVLFEWDNETFHSGRRSASISIRDNHPDDQIYYNWNQAPLNCKPGESYELTGWVKAQALTASAFIVIQCWDSGMKKVLASANTERNVEVVGTTEWVQVSAIIDEIGRAHV